MAPWWSIGVLAVTWLLQDSKPARGWIAGEVLDPAGKAASGVEVRLWRFAGETLPMGLPNGMNPALSAMGQVLTDGDGRFRLEVDLGRHYAVSAERAPAERAAPATVVPAGAALVLRLRAGTTLRGRVLSPATPNGPPQQGVADREITASWAAEGPVHSAAWPLPAPVPRTATSGSDGRFELLVPATMPGELCTLRATNGVVHAEAHGPFDQEVKLELTLPAPTLQEARTVTFVDRATGKPVSGVRVGAVDHGLRSDVEGRVLLSWPTLAGSVLPARHSRTLLSWTAVSETVPLQPGFGWRARLLRPDGTPLARVPVLLGGPVRVDRSVPRYEVSNDPWFERTDDAGWLDLHCLAPGTMVYAFVEMEGVYAPLFHLTPTKDIDLGEVHVSLDGMLRGTVRGPRGEPVPDARILLRTECEGQPADSPRSVWPFRLARAGANASFVVGAIRPGTWLVAAVSDDLRPQYRRVEIGPQTPPVRFDLAAGISVTGTVLFPDGTPAKGARVSIWVKDEDRELARFGLDQRFTTSDAQGRFALHGLHKEAPFMLHANCRHDGRHFGVTHEGGAVGSEPVELVLR